MKQKKMTRLLAGLLALVLLLSLVPVAFAAEGDATPATSGMVVDKKTELQADGTYTITLEAFSTGATTTTSTEVSVPLDIALVIDQSGSMSQELGDLKDAVENFVGIISNHAAENKVDHRIAMVGYASSEDSSDKWLNTGVFVNGSLINYRDRGDDTQPETVQTYEYVKIAASSMSTRNDYYILLSGEYQAIEARKTGTFFSPTYVWGYYVGNTWNQVDVNAVDIYDRVTHTEESLLPSNITAQNYKDALVAVNQKDSSGNVIMNAGEPVVTKSILTATDNLKANGATSISYGMLMANRVFENNPIEENSNRKRVVVVFTDGEPCTSGSNYQSAEAGRAVNYAYVAKHTHESLIYTMGYYSSASNNITNFMNYLSSNYPDAQYSNGSWSTGSKADNKYYFTTSNSSELSNIFSTISKDIVSSSSSVTLTETSVMKDIIGQYFDLPDGYNGEQITVEVFEGTTDDEVNYIFSETPDSDYNLAPVVNAADNTVTVSGFDYSNEYVAKAHPGHKLVVTISGIEVAKDAPVGTVFATNLSTSGIYADGEAIVATVLFPQPQTVITGKSYVLDYAKPATLPASDWFMEQITGEGEKTENYGTFSKTESSVVYNPHSMNWDGYDYLSIIGTPAESFKAEYPEATANENFLWSKINVIPATSVYYEDTFVTNETTGTVGITYTGEWSTAVAGANQETAGPVQGWVESLADDATVSDGTEATTSTAGAKATFNFTGTGVDIYSRTNLEAGVIRVKLFKVTDSGESMIKYLKMDCESASGEYYQIPTAFFSGLEHGEYKVELEVISTSTSNANYSLDGIRVYNPLSTGDKTVNDAYADNGISVDAVFTCLRDLLKDANALAPTESGLPQFSEEFANGNAVFIDKAEDGTTGVLTTSVGTYLEYGPKNEVYLAPGQALTFKVNGTPAYTYVGIKAPEGTGSATFSNNGEAQNATLSAADLYYAVTPDANGAIVITNSGDKIISVTKLMTPAAEGSALVNLSAEAAIEAVNAFSALPVAEYTGNTVTETPAEPEAPVEPDPTEPEIPDVEIENPEQPEEPEEPVVVIGWLQQLFSALRNWFRT